MALLNLPGVVEALGVSFSSLAARRDLLSFALGQLSLLNDTCRRLSRIDSLDSSYPKHHLLVQFLRSGSRVLEESIVYRNKTSAFHDLPRATKFATPECIHSAHTLLEGAQKGASRPQREGLGRFDRLLNDSLISFIGILGNSGLFLDNLGFIKGIIAEISPRCPNLSGLVCVVGVISKCDLFRVPEFAAFCGEIFARFASNRRILGHLSDLDATLLLFHKAAMLLMTQPGFGAAAPAARAGPNRDLRDLLALLEASVGKVAEMIDFAASDAGGVRMKSVNNLVQALFLAHALDQTALARLPLGCLAKIERILSWSAGRPGAGPAITNTSCLHLKIKAALESALSPHGGPGKEGTKKISDEIRVGAGLYFVDLLVA